jgi:hypothetical protein
MSYFLDIIEQWSVEDILDWWDAEEGDYPMKNENTYHLLLAKLDLCSPINYSHAIQMPVDQISAYTLFECIKSVNLSEHERTWRHQNDNRQVFTSVE